MKKFLLLLTFIPLFFSAQTNVIEYKYIYDQNSIAISGSEFLISQNHSSLYFRYGSANIDLTFDDFQKNLFDKYKLTYFILNSNEDVLFELGTKMSPTKILVKDKLPAIQWSIKKDNKKILGYNCIRAEGSFRGRNYIAWFTTELAFEGGPWKLQGLPGTILEVFDESRMVNFYATKINLNVKYVLSNEFQEYINEKKLHIINMEKYIAAENDYLRTLNSQILADMPIGSRFKSDYLRDSQKEIIFEWEKNQLKSEL